MMEDIERVTHDTGKREQNAALPGGKTKPITGKRRMDLAKEVLAARGWREDTGEEGRRTGWIFNLPGWFRCWADISFIAPSGVGDRSSSRPWPYAR